MYLSSFDVAQDDPELVEGSKDERPGSWFDKPVLSELALRQAQGERVEGLTTSGNQSTFQTAHPRRHSSTLIVFYATNGLGKRPVLSPRPSA